MVPLVIFRWRSGIFPYAIRSFRFSILEGAMNPPGKSATLKSIAIIGAGCSGLAAALILRDAGNTVTVFERSIEVGGRAATRRRQGFTYDHGAQYVKGGSAVSSAWITGRFRAAD